MIDIIKDIEVIEEIRDHIERLTIKLVHLVMLLQHITTLFGLLMSRKT